MATLSAMRPCQQCQHASNVSNVSNVTAAMAAFIVDRIVRAHLATMGRLNVGYDLLTFEGDILRLRFWAQAFDILKAQGAVFLQTEGRWPAAGSCASRREATSRPLKPSKMSKRHGRRGP